MKWGSKNDFTSLSGAETVRVLVGKEQREFILHKKLLCASSSYFRENLDATPAGLSSSRDKNNNNTRQNGGTILWFSEERPEMFELFVLWLYQRRDFRSLIDQAIQSVSPGSATVACRQKKEADQQELHWSLVRLNLFAALINLPPLQDTAMDLLQDLYLRCDWDMTPAFVSFLYGPRCDPDSAFRLRKWAVAMIAWTLYGGTERGLAHAGHFQRLFDRHPHLFEDYCAHLDKMAASGADVRIKNPQLRLPRNRLRSDERFFGFRQCSFHSHRSAVGEGACPHASSVVVDEVATPVKRKRAGTWLPTGVEEVSGDSEEEMEEDERGILEPVSEWKPLFFSGFA